MSVGTASCRELTVDELDILLELVNIGVGRSAASLSELIGAHIVLHAPSVRICTTAERHEWQQVVADHASTLIVQPFRGPIRGKAGLLFDEQSSLLLAQLLAGLNEIPEELDPEMSSTLLEVGNIVLNAVLGSLSNSMHAGLSYSMPTIVSGRDLSSGDDVLTTGTQGGELLLADVDFGVAQHEIRGSIVIAFAVGCVAELLDSVGA